MSISLTGPLMNAAHGLTAAVPFKLISPHESFWRGASKRIGVEALPSEIFVMTEVGEGFTELPLAPLFRCTLKLVATIWRLHQQGLIGATMAKPAIEAAYRCQENGMIPATMPTDFGFRLFIRNP